MSPERWKRVETLFHRAVDLDEAARGSYLEAECASDEILRNEVDLLLRAERTGGERIRRALEQEAVRVLQDADATGERLGAWRLLQPLQHGGMGIVYLAERADDAYRKKVAIKVLRSPLATAHERERCRTERQILAQLEHAGIARLIDGGTRPDGSPYLVMEFVEGEPIDRYCANHALSLEERLRLFQTVCRAVAYAHSQHVVHRDIKPANILVDSNGLPKLLDFGIAKLLDPATDPQLGPVTRAEDRRLTPEYASPEQLSGAAIGYASDIYALGVVLYELLAGCRPYQLDGMALEEMLTAIRRTDPLPPSSALLKSRPRERATAARLRGGLDSIVMKALQHEPGARYEDAGALVADIARYLSGAPVLARPTPAVLRLVRHARKRGSWLLVAAAAVACSVSAAFYINQPDEGERRVNSLIAAHVAPNATGAAPTIAVLPFGSIGSDWPMGVGISRLLIGGLALIKELRTTAYNSVRLDSDRSSGIEAAARELGARYVISGAVEVAGTRLRIEAMLTDTATGSQLWRETYDRTPQDLFTLAGELTERAVASLGIHLSSEQRRRLTKPPTRTLDAYRAVLDGIPLYGRSLPQANEAARRHFERAIALDPGYAQAHGYLALTYLAQFNNEWGDDFADALQHAEQLAERALALDESEACAHVVMGFVRRAQGRHGEALAEAARAAELNPNYANALALMASVLCYSGKPGDSIELIQRAARLYQQHPINYPVAFGRCYFAMGRYAEAVAAFEQALDRNKLGRRSLLWLVASYALSGRQEDARRILSEMETDGRRLSLVRIESTIPFANRESRRRMIEGLRLAGVSH